MTNKVFLDSNFAIALVVESDELHSKAVPIAKELLVAKTQIITTHPVLLEIGNALSKLRYRSAGAQLLTSLGSDPNVEIVLLTDELYSVGFRLFRDRPDKQWSLTDCISFVVMQQRGLIEALTSDEHFQQAGFRALLREK